MFDLDEIVASIQDGDAHTGYFINTRTNEIIIRSDRFPMWEQREIDDMLDKDYDSIIKLPNQRDAREFNMMRSFIFQLPAGKAKDDLLAAIKGAGAFKRFRDAARNFGLLEDWYDFRDTEYTNFARAWCEENEIEFVEVPKIYYRHAGRNDGELLADLRKKELGLAADDHSMDLELERYYSHQLRVNGIYQVLAWCKKDIVASGGVAFYFKPPTLDNPKGRSAWVVDFWCDEQFKDMNLEQEILQRLLNECSRRRIFWVNARGLNPALLTSNGFSLSQDTYVNVLDHEPIVISTPKEEPVAEVEEVVEEAE